MNKHELNIELVSKLFNEKVDTLHHYSPTKYPIIYGYNCAFSGRSGGKTTNILLWCLAAYRAQKTVTMYVKTVENETTRKYIGDLYNTINTYKPDGVRNYVQILTDDQYDMVLYVYMKKHYVLHKNTGSKFEKALDTDPVITNVCSLDKAYDMRSSHNCITENIIFYDEMINDKTNNESFLRFLHIIKTCFTNRPYSTVFMTGNLGTGNMNILHDMGIFNEVKSSDKDYWVTTSIFGSKMAIEIFNPDLKKQQEYDEMNERFFGFDCDGAEVVRGKCLPTPPTRKLPTNVDWEIVPTNIYIYALSTWLTVDACYTDTWQPMYRFRQCMEPKHDSTNIVITDDKLLTYNTPYSYYGVGVTFDICKDIANSYLRNDVCYDEQYTFIIIDAFYRNFINV